MSILGDRTENGRIFQTNEIVIAYSECGDDASNDDHAWGLTKKDVEQIGQVRLRDNI